MTAAAAVRVKRSPLLIPHPSVLWIGSDVHAVKPYLLEVALAWQKLNIMINLLRNRAIVEGLQWAGNLDCISTSFVGVGSLHKTKTKTF